MTGRRPEDCPHSEKGPLSGCVSARVCVYVCVCMRVRVRQIFGSTWISLKTECGRSKKLVCQQVTTMWRAMPTAFFQTLHKCLTIAFEQAYKKWITLKVIQGHQNSTSRFTIWHSLAVVFSSKVCTLHCVWDTAAFTVHTTAFVWDTAAFTVHTTAFGIGKCYTPTVLI